MAGIAAICVGGPLGGKRKHILYGNSFRSLAPEPFVPRDYLTKRDGPWDAPIAVSEVKYVTQDWRTPEHGVVQIWVPEGQTASETLEILLSTYQQHHKDKRP